MRLFSISIIFIYYKKHVLTILFFYYKKVIWNSKYLLLFQNSFFSWFPGLQDIFNEIDALFIHLGLIEYLPKRLRRRMKSSNISKSSNILHGNFLNNLKSFCNWEVSKSMLHFYVGISKSPKITAYFALF